MADRSAPPLDTLLALVEAALEERAREWPLRGDGFRRMNDAIDAYFEHLYGTGFDDPWVPDPDVVGKCDAVFERPLFVCGNMKSGTTLMAQLLDGHSRLFVLPGDTHFRRDWSGFDRRSMARHWVGRMISPTGLPPFWFLEPSADGLGRFLRYHRWFVGRRADGGIDVVDALKAILAAQPRDVLHWVEKTPENERAAARLAERFRGAKFIHVLRDVDANFAALKRQARTMGRRFLAPRVLANLVANEKRGLGNRRRLGRDRYLILRYENLVADPGAVMTEVAGFAGIDFEESLMIPTAGGKPAVANSMYRSDRVTGEIVKPDRKQKDPADGVLEKVMLATARMALGSGRAA